MLNKEKSGEKQLFSGFDLVKASFHEKRILEKNKVHQEIRDELNIMFAYLKFSGPNGSKVIDFESSENN